MSAARRYDSPDPGFVVQFALPKNEKRPPVHPRRASRLRLAEAVGFVG
jgi:hypothetical protein